MPGKLDTWQKSMILAYDVRSGAASIMSANITGESVVTAIIP